MYFVADSSSHYQSKVFVCVSVTSGRMQIMLNIAQIAMMNNVAFRSTSIYSIPYPSKPNG